LHPSSFSKSNFQLLTIRNNNHLKEEQQYVFSDIHGNSVMVSLAEVLFVQSMNGILRLHRIKELPLVLSTKIEALKIDLEPYRFFKIHRQCIVNLRYVEDYGMYPGKFLLLNGCEVRLAKRRRLSFHKAYLACKK